MVQDVVKERQVDVLSREVGVRKLTEYAGDVCHVLGSGSIRDVVDESLVNLHGIDLAAGCNGARERQGECPRAGTDVREEISGLEPEPGDDVIDPELLDSFWSTQGFDPPFGRSRPQLPSNGTGRAHRADDSHNRRDTCPTKPHADFHPRSAFARLPATVSFPFATGMLRQLQRRP